jgi:hypothetical protein
LNSPDITTTNLFNNMKSICILLLLLAGIAKGQSITNAKVNTAVKLPSVISVVPENNTGAAGFYSATIKEIKIDKSQKWRLTKNRIITGSLVFLAGSAKGFNESLQFNYHGFESIFPKANDQWFYPGMSFTNKYKDHDPAKGARFPLSTSVLVMFTDQYHLNNFIQRSALTAALVIKIGDGRKPLRHYLFDALYYTVCYQAGFHSIYGPIKARKP